MNDSIIVKVSDIPCSIIDNAIQHSNHYLMHMYIHREFIARSVKYLIRSGDDSSFRIDFLQPLTHTCLTASHKKKTANHFSVDTCNVINEVSHLFITFS